MITIKPVISFYYHLIVLLGAIILFYFWELAITGSDFFDRPQIVLLLAVSEFFALFCAYLIHYYTFCKWFLNRKNIVFYLFSLPVTLLLFAGIRYLFDEVILYQITGIHNYADNSRTYSIYILDNFFYGLPAIIMSTVTFLFWEFHKYQSKNQKLELENRKAELQLLKSQVSPHFLFNILNSFYSEWLVKDEKMANDLLQLSDMLRHIVTENDKENVPLSNELTFIENYIQLQKRRFENQLFIDFSTIGTVSGKTILPAVLIHFVENIFKHGLLNDVSKKAEIYILIENDFLEISTANHIQQGESYASTGIGYENLIKRLTYYYEENFILEKQVENTIFTCYLKIPLKTAS